MKILSKLFKSDQVSTSAALPMSRIDKAIIVKNNSVNDFFGGWSEEDIELLKKYHVEI
ncbi:MAG: hypothetical protein ACK443_00880 [Methylococcaceae bacterium]|jgi:hypothetical protein